jgi:hypothetical protein
VDPANPNPADPPADPNKPADPPEPMVAVEPLKVEDIKFPDGVTVSDELTKEFVDTLNNSELSPQERATALIDLQAKTLAAASEANSAAWTNLQDEWKTAVKTEFGDKLQPTLDSINKLVTEHGDAKLVEALAITGAGNNPEVIKFFSKMATLLTEGGYQPGSPSGQEKTAAQRMFPSMTN